ARDSHGAGNPLPPLLATAALTCDLTDEVMTRQLAQVVARRAGGFAEALGQARRRLRSVIRQRIVDRHPLGMGEDLEGLGIDLAYVIRGELLAHDAKIHLQRNLCKIFFASVSARPLSRRRRFCPTSSRSNMGRWSHECTLRRSALSPRYDRRARDPALPPARRGRPQLPDVRRRAAAA